MVLAMAPGLLNGTPRWCRPDPTRSELSWCGALERRTRRANDHHLIPPAAWTHSVRTRSGTRVCRSSQPPFLSSRSWRRSSKYSGPASPRLQSSVLCLPSTAPFTHSVLGHHALSSPATAYPFSLLSPGTTSATPPTSFKTASLSGLELTSYARLTSQGASEFHMSPPHPCWDYRHAPPCLDFHVGSGDQTHVFMLVRPALY